MVYEDHRGTIWAGTIGGLNKFDPASQSFTSYRHNPDDAGSLSSDAVLSLYEDSRGTFWVGTTGDGLHTMDRDKGTFTRFQSDPENPTALSSPFSDNRRLDEANCDLENRIFACGGVFFIQEDQYGILWIGGYRGGINRYDLETGAFRHHGRSTGDLLNDGVYSIMESHDGAIWVGNLNTTKMHRVVNSTNSFLHLDSAPYDEDDTGSRYVVSLMEDRQGGLWMGHPLGEGLDRYDSATDTFTHYRHDPDDPNSLRPGWIISLLEDRDGLIWIGQSGGALVSSTLKQAVSPISKRSL